MGLAMQDNIWQSLRTIKVSVAHATVANQFKEGYTFQFWMSNCAIIILSTLIKIPKVYKSSYSYHKKVKKLEVIKNFEFKKGVGIAIKSKETSR